MNFNFLKVYKAVTPSLRHTCLLNKSMLWKEKPFNYLCINLIKSRSGRNSDGKCIVYTKKSSKHKTIFRKLDFKYVSFGYVGTIHRIEYDTNRSSFISLVFLKNKMFCYVPYTENTYAGMCIQSVCVSASFFTGDFCMLKYISEGSVVHSLEKTPFYGSSYSRSAGTFSILIKKYIHINKGVVKLKSGEFKLLSLDCHAIVGKVSNFWYRKTNLGKAGRSSWLGVKPNVRGVAMNPIDHPHGGGQGKKSKKNSPRTFIGKMFKNKKTSSSNKKTLLSNFM